MLVLYGSIIGWACAPYDPNWERRHPRRAAWMALAGPATNYTLMLLAAMALRVGSAQGWLHFGPRPDFALNLLSALFSLNLLLGTFNLLPVPPLDGSTGIMLFMGESTAQRYLDRLRGTNYGILGLVVALVVFRYAYGPSETFVSRILRHSQF